MTRSTIINRQSTKNFDEARWEGLGCWPIPQAEINKNPNLEQNPGWEASNTDAQYRDLY